MKYVIILALLLYFISPYDLIPDMFGVLGRLDDLVIISYVLFRWWYLFKTLPKGDTSRPATGGETGEEKPFNACEVLGVNVTATQEEITAAYRARASEYHPDKVNHLGPDLQALAHEKMLDIQRAYEELREKNG